MAQQSNLASKHDQVITRMAVASQIKARLENATDDAALAAWAFERFYAEELGVESYEPGAETVVAEVLDALMFADDPSFHLDKKGLRDALARLGTV